MALDPSAMLELQKINMEERFGTADINSRLKFLRRGFRADRNELERQNRYKQAQVGDEMGARGLNFSGIALGAQKRGLEDLQYAQHRAGMESRAEKDALRRAMQKLKEESDLARWGVMLSSSGGEG